MNIKNFCIKIRIKYRSSFYFCEIIEFEDIDFGKILIEKTRTKIF